MTTLLATALKLVGAGWPVFPLHTPVPNGCSCGRAECKKPGKHPRTQNGAADATLDEAQARAWWTKAPHANIAVRTGAASGIFVLDVDVSDEADGFAALAGLEAKHGSLPATRTALTGRGGRHYYFKHPGEGIEVTTRAGKLGPGLDVRGDGGSIIVPPSLHASGKQYAWENKLPVAPAPAWLVELVKKPPAPPRSPVVDIADERARKYGLAALDRMARDLAVTKTARNDALNRAAFGIGQLAEACGVSESMAEGVLLDAAARCGLMEDDGRHQALATFRSGWKRGLDSPKGVPEPAYPARAERPAQATSRGRTQAQHDGDEDPERKPGIATISAPDLMAKEFSDPRWAVPGLLPEGLTVFAGRPKMGKSWLALGLCLAVAYGGNALGSEDLKVEQGEALYIALEDNERRLKNRLSQMTRGQPVPAGLSFACALPRFDMGGLPAIEDWLAAHPKARLVVVDTLAKFRPPPPKGGNAYEHDYMVLGALQTLALKAGVALVVVTHLRKAAGDDPFDQVTGSLAITGAADCSMVLARSRCNSDGTLAVTGRDVEERQLALRFDAAEGAWSLLGDAEDVEMHETRRRILEVLRETGEPMNTRDIADAAGINAGSARMYLSRMVRARQITRVGKGLYTLPPVAPVASYMDATATEDDHASAFLQAWRGASPGHSATGATHASYEDGDA